MGTLCNCVFFYFDTACLFDSWSDGSHKVCDTVMYGYIRYCAQKNFALCCEWFVNIHIKFNVANQWRVCRKWALDHDCS